MPANFEHKIVFTPGYDRRDERPSYGQHPMHLAFVVVGEKGALVFDILTGWYPDHTQRGTPRVWGCYAHYHLDHDPLADEMSICDNCEWLHNKPCVSEQVLSSTSAESNKIFDTFITQGEAGIWPLLDALYMERM